MSSEERSWGAALTPLQREALETCPDYHSAIKLLSQRRLVCGAMFTVVNEGSLPSGTPSVVIERTNGDAHCRVAAGVLFRGPKLLTAQVGCRQRRSRCSHL